MTYIVILLYTWMFAVTSRKRTQKFDFFLISSFTVVFINLHKISNGIGFLSLNKLLLLVKFFVTVILTILMRQLEILQT